MDETVFEFNNGSTTMMIVDPVTETFPQEVQIEFVQRTEIHYSFPQPHNLVWLSGASPTGRA
jgi:hypothetical protein